MAFDKQKFKRIGSEIVTPTVYSYITTDNYATVIADGYFNDLVPSADVQAQYDGKSLYVDDVIMILTSDFNWYVRVTAATAGSDVTVAPFANS